MPKYHLASIYTVLIATWANTADSQVSKGIGSILVLIGMGFVWYYYFIKPTDRV
jgi:hypothetical protein